MSTPIHTVKVRDLKMDDRILLKDLRVLTVLRADNALGDVTVKYRNLAGNEVGELFLDENQPCKVICPGWCAIDNDLADIL